MQGRPQAEKYVGQPVERVEDAALLTGRGRYADDVAVRAGTLHGAILRSPHAHAEIVSIDTTAALERPGVVAVLTGEDIQKLTDPFIMVLKLPLDQWSLAVDRVRFVGESVALVVAEDRYKAEDALEYIEVAYSPLPAAVDAEASAADGAPLVHEAAGTNLVSVRDFKYGDPDAAFAAAEHTIDLTISYPRNSQTPLECFVVVAEHLPENGAYDVLANFQGPYTVHPVMALALRVQGTGLRIRTPRDSGGGFGVKQAIFPYVVLMAAASKVVGQPVKWVEDRLEHLSASTAAPNRIVRLEAAVAGDGKITAFRFDQLDDYGAYLRPPMPGPLYRQHGCMTGAYDIENLAVTNRLVMTNKTPSGMVRGFGGPQMYFGIERMMERIAVELGLDPLDIIRRNLIPAGSFPYRAAAGALYDSGDYPRAVETAVRDGGLDELKGRREKARAEGRLYGIGYCAVVEPGQSNMGYLSTILTHEDRLRGGLKGGAVSHATVTAEPLGGVTVTADCIPQGQGQATALAQVVADELGLKPGDINVNLEHDTHKDAWSIATGNYSSRFSSSTAVAAYLAARKVRDKLARVAAQGLNVPADQVEFADGKVFAADNPENALSFHRVAGTPHWAPGGLPPDMEPGVREVGVWSPPELEPPNSADQINTSLTYGFVFDFCGVEVDRDTGEVRIDKYVTMHDNGKLLNPLLARGQVEGSFGWGVGIALYEEFAYSEDGSFLSGTFADYLCPTAAEVPELTMLHMETPSPFTPLGAKGLGEGNCMTTPVCVANAVANALGVKDVKVPLSPSRVSAMIHGEETPPPAGRAAAAAPKAGGPALAGEGTTHVPAPPEEVWRTLLDPEKLAAVIPGCHRLDLAGDNEFRAEITLGVGPVRGRFQASVRLSDLDPPHSVMLSGGLDGPLGSSRGEGRVRLEPHGGGTEVTYAYTVEVSGKVAAVGGRMLEGAARFVVGQFFERLAAQVGGPMVREPWWTRLLRALGMVP